MTAPDEQFLSYAKDFSELYARYDRLRRSLLHASGEVLEVAQALTEEEVVQRLEGALRRVLPGHESAAYLVKGEDLHRLGDSPSSFPARLRAAEVEVESGARGEGVEVRYAWIAGRRRRLGLIAHRGAPLAPDQEDLLTLLARYAGLALENLSLGTRRSPGTRRRSRTTARFLGRSPAIERILAATDKLSRLDSTILLEGETGTGKSFLARYVHDSSPRAKKPFVVLNCAAIPAQLVESELFGHEAGAFTGALKQRRGVVEQAEGGTLFLDEVAELPSDLQAKLLVFLEDQSYRRVGGETTLKANVRLISATNADLDLRVEEDRFRLDLLYRLRVFSLRLPPLRERGEDVLILARAMLHDLGRRYQLDVPEGLGEEVSRRLRAYRWPGNARELKNALERVLVLSEGSALDASLLPEAPSREEVIALPASAATQAPPLPVRTEPSEEEGAEPSPVSVFSGTTFKEAKEAMVEHWERSYLLDLLRRTGGNVSAAARESGLDKRHVHRKIKQYRIDVSSLRA